MENILDRPTVSQNSRWLPQGRIEQTVFWVLLTLLFFLLTNAASVFSSSVLTFYFPLLSLCGAVFTFLWKGKGLLLSCFVSILSLCFLPFSWGILGLLSSLCLDFCIARLAIEEIGALLKKMEEETAEQKVILHRVFDEKKETEEAWEEERTRLEEELKTWKEEAEQRRIEKQNDEKRIAFVQSEIDLLNEQKSTLLQESFEARKHAKEHFLKMQEAHAEREKLTLEIAPLIEEKNSLQHELAVIVQNSLAKENQIETLQQDINSRLKIEEELLLETQRLSQQVSQLTDELKIQQDISQCDRTQVIELKEKDSHLELTNISLMNALDKEKAEKAALQDLKDSHEQNLSQLKKSYAELDEKNQELSLTIKALSEQLSKIETKSHEEVLSPIDSQQFQDLSKEKARLEGLYLQLRSQFDEKSRILSQTRKELFQNQGKLLAMEREKVLQPFDPLEDCHCLEVVSLQNNLQILDRENQILEQEITTLEELVSRLLLP